MTHPSQEDLVLYYYGDAADGGTVGRHLAECPQCRNEFDGVKLVLERVQAPPMPELPEDYSAKVWSTLKPQLPAAKQAWWKVFTAPPKWAAAGAMAALLLLAFVAGGYWQRTQTPAVVTENKGQVRERVLLVAVGNHLERSQMVLVELTHAGGTNQPVDISLEQQQADDLIAANRLYRQTAQQAGETGMANVLEELERVLVEVARGPSELEPAELESLRKRIESQGILFKVKVLGSKVRDEQRPQRAEAPASNKS